MTRPVKSKRSVAEPSSGPKGEEPAQKKGKKRRRPRRRGSRGKKNKPSCVHGVESLGENPVIKAPEASQCIYCGPATLYETAYDDDNCVNKQNFTEGMFWLKCTDCPSWACSRCIYKLLNRSEEVCTPEEIAECDWHQRMTKFYQRGCTASGLGACCMLRREFGVLSVRARDEEELMDRMRKLSADKVPLIDGMMYCPELNAFVPSPSGTIQVHGFGDEPGVYGGYVHCVPSLQAVVEAAETGDNGEAAVYPRLISEVVDPVFLEVPESDFLDHCTGKIVRMLQKQAITNTRTRSN